MKLVTFSILTSLACAAPAFAGPGDPSRHPVCASFAKNAIKWNAKAKSIGCKLPASEVKQTEASKYKWCMNTNDAEFRVRSPQAAGHKAGLESHCTKQSGATIRLD